MDADTFGSYFKTCRIKLGRTLRVFCQEHGFDPGNISKLERGRVAPPASEEKLTEYARALNIAPGSDEWYVFSDLAAVERGRIPNDILSDEEVLGKMPVLFRTLRGEKFEGSKVKELIERIRRA